LGEKSLKYNDFEYFIHWSSVKEFSCLEAIDFALEAVLKF